MPRETPNIGEQPRAPGPLGPDGAPFGEKPQDRSNDAGVVWSIDGPVNGDETTPPTQDIPKRDGWDDGVFQL